jgi:hypothetical protein
MADLRICTADAALNSSEVLSGAIFSSVLSLELLRFFKNYTKLSVMTFAVLNRDEVFKSEAIAKAKVVEACHFTDVQPRLSSVAVIIIDATFNVQRS